MNAAVHLWFLAVCLVSAHARVDCTGYGVSGKRGPVGGELVITEPFRVPTWSYCYSSTRHLHDPSWDNIAFGILLVSCK